MCQKAIETTKKENAARAKNKLVSDDKTKDNIQNLTDTSIDETAKKQLFTEEGDTSRNVTPANQLYDIENDTDFDVLEKETNAQKEITCCQHFVKLLPNLGLL